MSQESLIGCPTAINSGGGPGIVVLAGPQSFSSNGKVRTSVRGAGVLAWAGAGVDSGTVQHAPSTISEASARENRVESEDTLLIAPSNRREIAGAVAFDPYGTT